ncbi:MAG: ABC transporter ATP-binding protein, partial [Wenyingzhuangia sp.]
MDSLISIKNLSISFNNQDKTNKVVSEIGFEVLPNQIVGVVGESGSGKSVTSMAIMGLLPTNITKVTGSILYNGLSLIEIAPREFRKIIGNEMSMIFQEPMTSLNPSLTCGEQVAEVLALHTSLSKKEIEDEVLSLFQKVKLPRPKKMMSQYPHELSGGQKQRIMIAMAIACKPKLLIADEPTTALDVGVQKEIVLLLKALQQETGMSILFITHDLALITEIAHHIVVMQKGKIVEQGSVHQVFLNPQEIYTKALINARPKMNIRLKELPSVTSYLEDDFFEEQYTPEERNLYHQKIYSQQPLLEVKNLKTYYFSKNSWFSKGNVVKAVDNVSFRVYQGETVGLVGESGSGKSTIGRTILNLEKATSGEIWYDGVNLLSLS